MHRHTHRMRARTQRCLHAALRSFRSALMCGAREAQCRCFVDTPVAGETVVSGMTVPNVLPQGLTAMGNPTPNDIYSSYAYPLDVCDASFKLYGESTTYAEDDANRIFASATVHSYDPAILFSDLRPQEAHRELPNPTGGLGAGESGNSLLATDDPEAATRLAEDEESDAVIVAGQNKQGAAAMAAAMLDSRRPADGIAMVPAHPLPVVFPRSNGPPPPLRFKKFGPGDVHQTPAGKCARQAKCDNEEDANETLCGEVMESVRHIESYSLQHSIAWRIQVLDEHCKPTPIKHFQHFRELIDVLPARALQGLSESGFTRPTLLQSVAIPQLIRGCDVVGVTPDGSGVTVAYAVPSLAVLMKIKAMDAARENERMAKAAESSSSSCGDVVAHPIVVVLCATRQTVLRTAAMYSSLAGEDVRLVAAYRPVGSDNEDYERIAMCRKEGCDVIVATPACLTRMVSEAHVALDRVHVLAVEKANHLLVVDPTPDGRTAMQYVEDIMRAVKGNGVAHQFSLWCAELEPPIETLVRKYMSPLTGTVMVTREEHTNVNVRQILYPLSSRDDRITAIQKLYDQGIIVKRDQVMVYCACRETVEEVTRELIKTLSAPSSMVRCVHSGLCFRKRNEVFKAFQHGDVRILVGTDAAMERLYVEELEHVIHYDLPALTEVYVQRVNQVGRSGRQGTSHTFLIPGDAHVPIITRFVERQTDHALNDTICKMVADIEAAGAENSWDTPVLRMQNHAVSKTTRRVRGRRAIRQRAESLSDFASARDKSPAG
ncbi:DEAD/DEAH_box_helicase (plasmid) [Leishmania braziliensis MHOM/BR/75/M2904]|nr:DEAD/DEAH_box_helicase [Leishmania braziliensis MHOM/BR/75/M2904]